MKEKEQQPKREDPRKLLNEALLKILESYDGLCMDDPLDRQRLADVLTDVMWENKWGVKNVATTE